MGPDHQSINFKTVLKRKTVDLIECHIYTTAIIYFIDGINLSIRLPVCYEIGLAVRTPSPVK